MIQMYQMYGVKDHVLHDVGVEVEQLFKSIKL